MKKLYSTFLAIILILNFSNSSYGNNSLSLSSTEIPQNKHHFHLLARCMPDISQGFKDKFNITVSSNLIESVPSRPNYGKGRFYYFRNESSYTATIKFKNKIITLAPHLKSIDFFDEFDISYYECGSLKVEGFPVTDVIDFVGFSQELTPYQITGLSDAIYEPARKGTLKAKSILPHIEKCEEIIQKLATYKNKLPKAESTFHESLEKLWHETLVSLKKRYEVLSGQEIASQQNQDKTKNNSSGITVSENRPASNNTAQRSVESGPTNSSAIDQSENEHKLQEEAAARKLAALNESIKEKQEFANAAGNAVGQLGSSIIRTNQAVNAHNERLAAESYAYTQKRRAEGQILIQNNISEAKKGNEGAISQVISGYQLTNNDIELLQFSNEMWETHESDIAFATINNYYQNKINFFKKRSSSYIRKGTALTILTAGAIYGMTEWANSIDYYAEPERESEYDAITYATVGVAVVGVIASFSKFMKVGYKSDPEYISAVNGLEKLHKKPRVKLGYSPRYDAINGTYGLAISLKF